MSMLKLFKAEQVSRLCEKKDPFSQDDKARNANVFCLESKLVSILVRTTSVGLTSFVRCVDATLRIVGMRLNWVSVGCAPN